MFGKTLSFKIITMLCAKLLLGMFSNGTFAQDMDVNRLDAYFNTLENPCLSR